MDADLHALKERKRWTSITDFPRISLTRLNELNEKYVQFDGFTRQGDYIRIDKIERLMNEGGFYTNHEIIGNLIGKIKDNMVTWILGRNIATSATARDLIRISVPDYLTVMFNLDEPDATVIWRTCKVCGKQLNFNAGEGQQCDICNEWFCDDHIDWTRSGQNDGVICLACPLPAKDG